MSDNNTAPQIEVNASPLPDQLWAGVRQIAPALTAFALGRHWIENDVAAVLMAVGGMAWPIIAGQIKTRHRANQLANIAADPRVPNEVVVAK
jgi:hypothetical protein